MTRPLPYPGHSWPFSQHAVGLTPRTLYDFLKCAAPFEGQTDDYDDKITELMIATGVLTANERDGSPDSWRHYLQLLAELGLIYSTLTCPALTLTELGHIFLAGEIGFSELLSAQALRYQYPNGQKWVIQGRLRNVLVENSIPIPDTFMELQATNGVLLKPGSLILRILLTLKEQLHTPLLSVSECQAFLIPCKTNSEWTAAYSEIVKNRSKPSEIDQINRHARRNIQDWFKLLSKTDFFEIDNGNLKLSAYAVNDLELVRAYCELQEDIKTFWIPIFFDRAVRLQWFDYFGHLTFDTQKALRFDIAEDADYVEKNYQGGIEEEEDDLTIAETATVNLQPIDLDHLERDTFFNFTDDIEALADRLRKGAQKRHAKTLLHDRIIKSLAEKFLAQGATVESDPNSIDLFTRWPSGDSAIFEVKTVTRRSIQGRLRTAIGQVQEYAYRREIAGVGLSEKVVVINTELTDAAWQTNFLTAHLNIGLICKSLHSYKAFAPQSSASKGFWIV